MFDDRKLQRTLEGWGNPRGIQLSLSMSEIAALRAGIRRDLETLAPRCDALDASLSADDAGWRRYQESKTPLISSLRFRATGDFKTKVDSVERWVLSICRPRAN